MLEGYENTRPVFLFSEPLRVRGCSDPESDVKHHVYLSAACDSWEKGVGDKGSTRTMSRLKTWYARNAMICEPCIVKALASSYDKAKASCLTNNIAYTTVTCLEGFYVAELTAAWPTARLEIRSIQ